MVAIAFTAIEAAVARVLVALGVGAVAGAAGEAARKRQKEADEAKAAPIARADVRTKEKCKNCTADEGKPYLRNTAGWPETSIAYQIRITQMPPAPPGFLTEWDFGGTKFDGFRSAECLLMEAKARYDQFFDEWGGFKYRFQDKIFMGMLDEAVKQNNAAVPKPPIQLQWYFMEPTSYRYMSKILSRATPQIEVLYRP
ncbi:Tox-REase-5 domain-containing protein [Duganella vulcania]|uniref:Tox-REase-5 domain-containing protein n=1 Tax=Duganella vulcania TaxID=2692166 RepID=A0A845GWJ0_9BURK|nr:Tox-REase-5 domain-containing protein [Duganella vulcania]MYM96879.1 hypothetical protein [Duganella vulcania]